MKILVALPYAPSLIRVRPYNLVRELARRHEIGVLIAGPAPTSSELDDLYTLADTVEVVSTSALGMGLSLARAALLREPLQAAVNRSAAAGQRMVQLLHHGLYDVVHVEHLRGSFLEAWMPPETPRVLDAVDSISLLWERTRRASLSRKHRLIASLELGATRRYEARMMARYDRVAVTSPEDADALRQLAPAAPLTVIPNGVDLDYFRLRGSLVEPATLVFSGKMSYHANVTAALHFVRDILPRVRQAVPNVRLRIVGNEPPPAVKQLAADPQIEVTGYLDDLRPAISSATVAVCPVTVKVGIQNKILEAMALGVPVVSSALGARGLTARAGRDLMVADDDDRFAQHVIALLKDDLLQARLASAGRQYVERAHSWPAAVDAFERLYQAAIGARTLPSPSQGGGAGGGGLPQDSLATRSRRATV
ncbi:MAG: glycosyltransferase [Chloroflexota bacterium]